MAIVLQPLVAALPLFAAFSLFFINPPKVQIELGGFVGSVVDIPFIAEVCFLFYKSMMVFRGGDQILQTALVNEVSSAMALPNRVCVPVIEDQQILAKSDLLKLMVVLGRWGEI